MIRVHFVITEESAVNDNNRMLHSASTSLFLAEDHLTASIVSNSGIFKNKGTYLWNFFPNYELGKNSPWPIRSAVNRWPMTVTSLSHWLFTFVYNKVGVKQPRRVHGRQVWSTIHQQPSLDYHIHLGIQRNVNHKWCVCVMRVPLSSLILIIGRH